MKLSKTHHEGFARFFEQPTRESFRELIRQGVGETDYLDFKSQWPDLNKVAKHILALGNSGGGAIVVGINQHDDGSLEPSGLEKLKDKVEIVKFVKKYLPSSLSYDVIDFAFEGAEYPAIKGKKFQVIIVEYSEKYLPLLALKSGSDIKGNVAYIREGTESIEANHEQLEHLINLRVESGYSSSHTLDLQEHLEQLKVLYQSREETGLRAIAISQAMIGGLLGSSLNEYYDFIEEQVERKKARIERELDT
jgi:Divergent AAA domain.